MEKLNYSFPGYFFNDKYETQMEVDMEENFIETKEFLNLHKAT